MTGVPWPNSAYQILIPFTGANPLCSARGRTGVGGKVVHCDAACASSVPNNNSSASNRLDRHNPLLFLRIDACRLMSVRILSLRPSASERFVECDEID